VLYSEFRQLLHRCIRKSGMTHDEGNIPIIMRSSSTDELVADIIKWFWMHKIAEDSDTAYLRAQVLYKHRHGKYDIVE